MDSRTKTRLACEALDEKKGQNIHVIDIEGVSVIADYFIIANGENRPQVLAMADAVQEKLGRAGEEPRSVEGYAGGNWVLLDYNDLVVHGFSAEDRRFFDLERIWRDGKDLDWRADLADKKEEA